MSKALDLTAAQCFSTDKNRAQITACLIIDMFLVEPDFLYQINLSEESYVGKEGTIIFVYVQGNSSVNNDFVLLIVSTFAN